VRPSLGRTTLQRCAATGAVILVLVAGTPATAGADASRVAIRVDGPIVETVADEALRGVVSRLWWK
jgi:hypothetical protein